MIYIRNIFTQDLRDGKQIAFPNEPSNLLFKFSFSNKDPDRKISFKFKEKNTSSPYFQLNDKTISTRIYSAGSESRIDGELKHFLKVDLNAKVNDIIVFRAINLALYEFELIPRGATFYTSYKDLLNGKNHEVIIEHINDDFDDINNDNILFNNADLLNLKDDFATWFINLDGSKHNYYSDSFGSNRDKLLDQLAKYEKIYKEQFDKSIFSFQGEDPNEFINELEKNLYLEEGSFFEFSLKISTHMPRAILGRKNYIKFLKELLALNKIPKIDFNYKTFHQYTKDAGLIFTEKMVARFVASLCTKPFVICSGLSGSGKTKLAQSFVQWISKSDQQYKIIPVGADWTNREPLLGYPNALKATEYISPDNGVLDLILQASNNKNLPYFLILDEMNLSHVERYFADFLSTMESKDAIPLHSDNLDGVSTRQDSKGDIIPNKINLPSNLFIIGTVNIDETTYMFSPKVLDRANAIEFRITDKEIENYLDNPGILDMKKFVDQVSKKGFGASMASNFLNLAEELATSKKASTALVIFFKELKKAGAEFGYRSASEINRLVAILESLTKEDTLWDNEKVNDNDFIDIAIMQKLLPKLHGSRSKLCPILLTLAKFCILGGINDFDKKDDDFRKTYFKDFDDIASDKKELIIYPISFEKIARMHKNAIDNGFTSYAEA